MTDPSDVRRKRVLFRSHHTGMKENDFMFGRFADEYVPSMTDDEVAWFESLLMDNSDNDLYEWAVGRRPVPEAWDHPVMRKIRAFVDG